MNKLPWAKYLLSIWIVAITASMMVKFVSSSIFILVPFCMGLYWLSVRGLAQIKGYE
jgi:hypothetical protein